MEQQTTRDSLPAVSGSPDQSLGALLSLIEDLRKQVLAKQRRIDFLEHVLAQRIELTENRYSEKRKCFDRVCDMVYQVFLRNPARGFSYDEFDQEFRVHFPNVPTGHLGRRLRDLRDQERLWSDVDPETREVRFWLRLQDDTEIEHGERANLKRSMEK